MKRVLILLVAVTSLCALVLMAQMTNDNTRNIFGQVLLMPAAQGENYAVVMQKSDALQLPYGTLLVGTNAGANLDLMAAVSSPPNCNSNLVKNAKNAQVQVAADTAANTGNVNTGPPAAAIVQVMNVSPPQREVAVLASDHPPNVGDAFLVMRAAFHRDGQSQASVAMRANNLVT